MKKITEYQSKLDYLQNKFFKLLESLSPNHLSLNVRENTKGWTVIELLRHIAVSENEIVLLMNQIVKGTSGVDENFNLNGFNEGRRRKDQIIKFEEIKQIMITSRENTLNFLTSTKESDWERTGRYFNQEIMPISHMFEILMWHQSHHIKQIIAKLNYKIRCNYHEV